MRKAGVLLNISMLSNDFGIGGIGDECVDFARWLHSIGFKSWQILPITSIGLGNSPYSGVSAFAGNFLYIDPKTLQKSGLISDDDYQKSVYHGNRHLVDYEFAIRSKKALITSAQNKILEMDEFKVFCATENYWLNDYCEFMAIKEIYANKPWYDWVAPLRDHCRVAIDKMIDSNRDTYNFYLAEQFLFNMMWSDVRQKINDIGIEIIGDMPIYVSHDSADVWANQNIFELDENKNPIRVAGVPPDYFSKDGQLWGNPLYDYSAMAVNNYQWFVNRAKRMNYLYDVVRFDHFRAFDRYWAVPNGESTAINGQWIKADGEGLFNAIFATCDNINIIAEDLGIIDDGVIELRDKFNLAGMRVMQFGMDDPYSTNSPHNYIPNTIAYTGTHDNNTTFGWLYEISESQRRDICEYIGAPYGLDGGTKSVQLHHIIRTLLNSVANNVILPFQDLCGWGSDTRMNIPGKADNNWLIRIVRNDIDSVDSARFSQLIKLSGR